MFDSDYKKLLDKAIQTAQDWKKLAEDNQKLANNLLTDLADAREEIRNLLKRNDNLVIELAMYKSKETDRKNYVIIPLSPK